MSVQARDEAYDELLPEGSQLIQGFSEDASASSLEGLDLYAEEWYADCLNDPETQTLPTDDLYVSMFLFLCLSPPICFQ